MAEAGEESARVVASLKVEVATANKEAAEAKKEAADAQKEAATAQQHLVRLSTSPQTPMSMARRSPAQMAINAMNNETIQNLSALVTQLRRELDDRQARIDELEDRLASHDGIRVKTDADRQHGTSPVAKSRRGDRHKSVDLRVLKDNLDAVRDRSVSRGSPIWGAVDSAVDATFSDDLDSCTHGPPPPLPAPALPLPSR